MMGSSSGEDAIKAIQKILDPYIRPREEVAHIRRILTLHLDSCVKDPSISEPLALVDATGPASLSTARGLRRDYLEALNANIQARNEFRAQCRERNLHQLEEETSSSDVAGQDTIHQHLATIKLEKKRERLEAVQKHLEILKRKPAASEDFMKPEEIFKDSRPLPKVPSDLVTALGFDKAATSTHLKDLIDQLEKHVLRTKLLLKREEQLLEQVKSRSTASPESITDSAKLEALSKTRVELISWIETELSKASGDDADSAGDDGNLRKSRGPRDTLNMDDQLASIKEKYTQYLEARKALLQLVSLSPKPEIKSRSENRESQDTATADPGPAAHLLAPYLEQLLAISREQKGLITQKSHLNHTITKQVKENCQILDHLADESLLIPAHPMVGAGRPKPGSSDSGSTPADKTEVSSRAKPWVFAADSAKIATLEAVAEKIDEGQVAVESSMRTLAEMDVLLGRQAKQKQDGHVEEDLWLDDGRQQENTRKHTDRRGSKPTQPKTVFDMLDGNLGLLRSEQDPP